MAKRTLKLAAALAFLALAPCAHAADWWVIFGEGDTPNRQLYYADAASISQAPTAGDATEIVQRLQVMQMFESAAQPEYILFSFEIQCERQQMRIPLATVHLRDGSVSKLIEPMGWGQPVPGGMVARAFFFTCVPKSRDKKHSYMRIGEGEAESIVSAAWKSVWSDGSKPSVQKKSAEQLSADRAAAAASLSKSFETEK